MKIAIRTYGSCSDDIDGFGGGEQRYTANLAYFLKEEGHELVRTASPSDCDSSFDLVIDAAWEDCYQIRAKKHIHIAFNPLSEGYRDFPCFSSGSCVIGTPYARAYNESFNQLSGLGPKLLFIPFPYPDSLVPENLLPGFERKEIIITTKDWANTLFGENHPIFYNGIRTLKALLRLSKDFDFVFNFGLKHHMPNNRGIMELVNSFPRLNTFETLPFRELEILMGRNKFNCIVGDLSGCILDSIATRGLPITYGNDFFSVGNIYGNMGIKTATEVEIYELLHWLWSDRDAYELGEYKWQTVFEDHRTAGLRKHFKNMCEELELS